MAGNLKQIAIIGSEGYVGSAQKKLWSYNNQYEVFEYDEPKKIGSRKEVNNSILAVICVPTPMKEDGECDTSIVEEVVSWIETPILIKSTIPPGTTKYLSDKYKKHIVFSPEFIGENKYWSPFKFHYDPLETPFLILGGKKKDTKYIYDLILPILGPSKEYRFVCSKVAEMTKYMTNCWGSMKVTWANEMKKICDSLDLNFGEVRELWALDPRVEKLHTAVFEDKPGFGGKCFPKDVSALIRFSEKAGYDPKLIKQMLKSNEEFRK